MPIAETIAEQQRFVETPNANEYWNIDLIVNQLRSLRDASLAARQRLGRPVKLPSRKALAGVAEGLTAALFPNRLGARELTDESVDFFVGHTLDLTLRELRDQIAREFLFTPLEHQPASRGADRAAEVVRQFADRLPQVRASLESDIQAAYATDSAAGSVDEILAYRPDIAAIAHYRLAHVLYVLGATLTARIIAEVAHSTTGISIHPAAKIGASFCIEHGTGVVIGPTVLIGDRVRLHHGVTLDVKHEPTEKRASETDPGECRPIVEDDVVIYAGAAILGQIVIGRGSVVGGNVWLTKSVPPNTLVSQAVIRSEECSGGGGI